MDPAASEERSLKLAGYRRLCGTVVLATAAVALAGSATAGADEIVARAAVPSAEKRQGEVRLLRRGDRPVVQTVILSKVLRRVAGEIAKKEARNWPATTPGSEDAGRYVEALRRVVDGIRSAPARDRERSMLIEFSPASSGGTVLVSNAEVEEGPQGLVLAAATAPAERVDVSREYAERNMRLIIADAFAVTLEEAGVLLKRAAGDPP